MGEKIVPAVENFVAERTARIVEKHKRLIPWYAKIAEGLIRPEYLENSQRNIRRANEFLGQGGSLLVISNHRRAVEHQQCMTDLLQRLNRKGETGLVLSVIFEKMETMSAMGKLVPPVLEQWGIEPIFVWREGVDDPKYRQSNGLPLKRMMKILSSPGGVVALYPSGVTGNVLGEAKETLGGIAARADGVLITTTAEGERKNRPRVMVDKILRTKEAFCGLRKGEDKRVAEQLLGNYIMTKMALGLEPKERGFYFEAAKEVEEKVPNERWERLEKLTSCTS